MPNIRTGPSGEQSVSPLQMSPGPLVSGPEDISGLKQHQNIKFDREMGEWAVLARLQDYQAHKQKESEKVQKKKTQQDYVAELNRQRMEQAQIQSRQQAAQKQIDDYMVEMDRKLFEEDKQRRLNREQSFRREVQDTLAKEEMLKQMKEQVRILSNLSSCLPDSAQFWHKARANLKLI